MGRGNNITCVSFTGLAIVVIGTTFIEKKCMVSLKGSSQIENNDDYTTVLERAIMSVEIHGLLFHKVLDVWIFFYGKSICTDNYLI
ncbi:MAG TPA: hypothetical protein VFZ67_12485 [Nitrososphaera sp.]